MKKKQPKQLLKGCPVCNQQPELYQIRSPKQYYYECDGQKNKQGLEHFASGPACKTKSEALRLWNQRLGEFAVEQCELTKRFRKQ